MLKTTRVCAPLTGAFGSPSFRQAGMRRSGSLASVTDFIQQLPVMQGFTVLATSVGGGGGGTTTASIHGLGAPYSLVLLKGRRVALASGVLASTCQG